MLNIDEIRARAKRAIDEEFPDGPVYGNAAYYCVTGDVPALCDEVERLRKETAVLHRALEMAEDMLTKMTPFKSKGGWHDRLMTHAREETEK